MEQGDGSTHEWVMRKSSSSSMDFFYTFLDVVVRTNKAQNAPTHPKKMLHQVGAGQKSLRDPSPEALRLTLLRFERVKHVNGAGATRRGGDESS